MDFLATTRRRATAEELDQGMVEMLEEKDRLARERVAIEDQTTQTPTPVVPRGSGGDQREGGVVVVPGSQGMETPNPREAGGGKGKGTGSWIEERGSRDEEMMRTGASELWTGGPFGLPQEHGGALFTEEQMKMMMELQQRAPLLMGREREVPRPAWMVEEELRFQAVEMDRQRVHDHQLYLQRKRDEEGLDVVRRLKALEREREELRKANEELMIERERLKDLAREGGFETPDENKKSPKAEEGKKEEEEENKGKGDVTNMTLRLMMKMMEKMIEKDENKKGDSGGLAETVRYGGGGVTLPTLPEWNVQSAPLDLGDWFTLIESHMGDLSATSFEWWARVTTEAKEWYVKHQTLGPLEKVTHKPEPSMELKNPRWTRLERRASALLLTALPEAQKDEMIATQSLSPLAIVAKLMVAYQPGGLAEKGIILRALEQPEEAQSLPHALTLLRRWIRWKRRAQDVAVILPDPSILVRGLNRMMKKVLEGNKELNFRISLAKTTLMVESIPREETVQQLAEHLVAEVEQIAHLDPKAKPEPKPIVKRFEENQGRSQNQYQKPDQRADLKKEEVCKFFTSDQGCRKGKACKWSHVMDDQKRCWTCGSKDHFSTTCPRKEGGERQREGEKDSPDRKGGDGGKGAMRTARSLRKEEETGNNPKDGGEQTQSSAPTANKEEVAEGKTEAMKELLQEANKMLRMLHKEKDVAEERRSGSKEGRLDRLQQQLDDLKTLKVFKVAKIQHGSGDGLLDSGATHALRGKRPGEDTSTYREVKVTLACGRETNLHMTGGGTMIHSNPATEPIVPLGKLVGRVGCRLGWDEEGILVHHPNKGKLPVEDKGGCPHVPRALALELIEELEEGERRGLKTLREKEADEEERILREMIQSHPVLSTLPLRLQQRLVVPPAQDLKGLPNANKRLRRQFGKHGMMVHLYAGEDQGFTLKRALQEAGGKVERLVELDVKRGENQDLTQDQPYASLLRAALDNQVDSVLAGPNCRTRSVLRHYPISQNHHGPRPLRKWGGEEFGLKDLEEDERKKIEDDDLMMWRAIFIYIVAKHVRRAEEGQEQKKKKEVRLMIEQPASPPNHPEVVSLWRTTQWTKMEEIYGLSTQTFNQGDWGGVGVPVKPTTIGGDIVLQTPKETNRNAVPRGQRPNGDSKDLERWVPGFMRAVARALVEQIEGEGVKIQVLSWAEHVAHGHIPFRKDCLVCQQASSKGKPHRRLGKNVKGGVLSVDTSGPFLAGEDVTPGAMRFLLVGAFTWVVPKNSPLKEDEDAPEEGEDEEWPTVDEEVKKDEEGASKPKRGRPKKKRPDDDGADGFEEMARNLGGVDQEEKKERELSVDRLGEDEEDGLEEHKPGEEEEAIEEKEDYEVKVFRMLAPLESKRAEGVLHAVADMILRLKADGFEVVQVHSDNGGEFVSAVMKKWMINRGYIRTYTAGDDPQSNGRVENSVQQAKSQMRRLLHQGGLDAKFWPLAARHLNEVWRYQRIGKKQDFPTLNAEVLVRKRHWNSQQLSPTMEKVNYVAPNHWSHGHWVGKDGEWITTRYVMARVWNPITDLSWIALEDVREEPHEVRRRIRGKTASGSGDPVAASSGLPRVTKMVQEEMKTLLEDEDEGHTRVTLKSVGSLRSFMETQQEEEVLQTRIVGINEVVANQEEWKVPIKAELDSLLEEKKALKPLNPEEKKEFFQKASREGRQIEVVPGKLVPTIKPAPGGGKKKARIVACGNFTAKDAQEELYAGTGDVVTFRMMLQYASEKSWEGVTMDIRTAFLNTPWDDEDVLVRPPGLLVRMGLVPEGVLWQPTKALYGFRKSPRLWGCHRDSILRGKEIEIEGKKLKMTQFLSEPNLWKIGKKEEEGEEELERLEEVRAMMLVYVDDIFMVGERRILEEMVKTIQQEWNTSTPEWVMKEPVRFLGMEISQQEGVWLATQRNYTKDLLKRNLGEDETKWPKRKIPFTKEAPKELTENPNPDSVRTAQKIVGELLWLVTRTRPDLMYAVSRLSSATLSNPGWVGEAAPQVWGYLAATWEEGILYQKVEDEGDWEDGGGIEAFSDASFAPGGEESHGAVVVALRGGLLLWKSGKQPTVSLSTAEAELNELIEGLMVGESVAALVQELEPRVPKHMVTDSQAAVGICMSDGGSWRTRHLRLRAAHAKQRFTRGDWLLKHRGGENMLADIGTKPLQATRLSYLKKGLNMGLLKKEEEDKNDEIKEGGMKIPKEEEVEKILKMVIFMAAFGGAEAQGGREEGWGWEMRVLASMLLLAMFGAVVLAAEVMKRVKVWIKKQEPEEEPRDHPVTPRPAPRDPTSQTQTPENQIRERRITYVVRTPQGARTPSSPGIPGTPSTRPSPVRSRAAGSMEPAGEPQTLLEEFQSTLVFEEIYHGPEVDPEDIPAGKGEPHPSWFKGKGRGRDHGGKDGGTPKGDGKGKGPIYDELPAMMDHFNHVVGEVNLMMGEGHGGQDFNRG